nr:glycosyltransferase [Noviherbaspirillum sp. L7-7A]
MPVELQGNIEKIRSLNPDWTHKLYDDSDIIQFIEEYYDSHVLRYFLKIDRKYGAARADLFRYLLIYKIGGIYLDIKASAEIPLNTVLHADDSFILSQWNDSGQFKQWGTHYDLAHVDGGEFQQWHIAAKPGHPFLKAVIESVLANIDRYNSSLHGTGKTGVIKLTGPVAYTAAIAPLLNLHPHRLLKDHREIGLLYSVYNDESGERINEVHKTSFHSHYSGLTHPIVIPTMKKRAFTHITGLINAIHTLTQKNNLPKNAKFDMD